MIPLSLAEVARAVGGSTHDIPDETLMVTGPVIIDSREVVPGALFVAFAGERVDGHDFAGQAVRDGAAAVLASRPVGVPAIVVDDVQSALGALARHVIERLGATVVALTGSAGKTSTKDLMAQLLEKIAPTVYTPGSLNNEIGLPLTALKADGHTRHLVLEMGARGIGHIAYLTGLTPPRIGVVLNVGSAHIGEFGGREQIAQAKGEMVESLPDEHAGESRCSTPTTRWCWRWRTVRRPGCCSSGRASRPPCGPPTCGSTTGVRRSSPCEHPPGAPT